MKFNLLFAFILVVLLKSLKAFDWPASPLDKEFEGECPSIQIACMPYAKLSFANEVWKGQSQDYWVKELNKELKSGSSIKKKMYVRTSQETSFANEYGIFFGEKVTKGDVLGEFTTKNLITSELNIEAFKGKPYYQEHRKIFSEFKWYGNPDAVLRLTLNLLYHFYHIDDSPVASDLRALPQTVNMLAFTANRYEVETILKNEITSSFINSIRNRTMYEYAYLKSYLNKYLGQKEIEGFLNGRKMVSPDDFVYATAIIYQRSVSDNLKVNDDIKFYYFLPFSTHFAKPRDIKLSDGGYIQTEVNNKTGEYHIKLISNDNYEKGDEFLIDYFITENFRMLALHNIPFKDNFRDCLKMKFLDENITSKYELPSEACITVEQNQLSKYYMMGDIENMTPEEKEECEDILQQYTNDPVQRTKAFMEKCAHPVWEKVKVWDEANEILEQHIDSGKLMELMATQYINQRAAHNMSTARGIAIRGYAIEKVKNANTIKDDISFYQRLARTDIKGRKIKDKTEL